VLLEDLLLLKAQLFRHLPLHTIETLLDFPSMLVPELRSDAYRSL
jgi:hypothetical protein